MVNWDVAIVVVVPAELWIPALNFRDAVLYLTSQRDTLLWYSYTFKYTVKNTHKNNTIPAPGILKNIVKWREKHKL